MQWFTQKNLAASGMGLVALLLLSIVGVHSYQTIISLFETKTWEKQTYEVLKDINASASNHV